MAAVLLLNASAPIAAPIRANGRGTVKNRRKSGLERPPAGTNVATMYWSNDGTFNVIRTTIKLLKNKPTTYPRTPPNRAPLRPTDAARLEANNNILANPVQ